MQRNSSRRPLWQVIILLVVLPPIGLLVLWRSSHRLFVKSLWTGVTICLIAGALFGISKVGYAPWSKKEIPPSGIAVEKNDRNR
ncbi:MAG: hypothetical protein ACPL7O_05405, partial [Armatimonadota bacterium]